MTHSEALLDLGACAVVDLLRQGEVTPLDLLDALAERTSRVEPLVNALPVICMDRARDAASAMTNQPGDARGLLAGLPVPIKDLSPVAGVRTTYGSKVFENFVPDASDHLVQTIESNGGVVYAKSNTPEFGAGGNTFNDVYGITRNPFNLALSPAGSSGGAAAALATGEAWLAQGSDMAGSLRTPASFCGVVSLRPSPGLIAGGPALLPFEVLGQNGPMARNISDLGLFLDAMVGINAGEALSQHQEHRTFAQAAREPVQPMRIAFSEDLGVTRTDPEVADICARAVERLQAPDVVIEQAHPDLSESHFAFDTLRAVAYAAKLGGDLEKNRHLIKPEVVWNVEHGLAMDGDAIRNAMVAQGTVFKNLATFLQDYDFLAAPAASEQPMVVEERYIGYQAGLELPEYYRWLAIAYAVTTATQPVVTLPCGVTSSGMPVGLQLIGKSHHEYQLLSHAAHVESVLQWQRPEFDPAVAAACANTPQGTV